MIIVGILFWRSTQGEWRIYLFASCLVWCAWLNLWKLRLFFKNKMFCVRFILGCILSVRARRPYGWSDRIRQNPMCAESEKRTKKTQNKRKKKLRR